VHKEYEQIKVDHATLKRARDEAAQQQIEMLAAETSTGVVDLE
jgi:hypothetical protein